MNNKEKNLDIIVADATKFGFTDVRIRDVAFAVLQNFLNDSFIAYMVAFPTESKSQEEIDEYCQSPMQKFLQKRITKMLSPKQPKKETTVVIQQPIPTQNEQSEDDISFEQNKAELLRLLHDIEEGKNNGSISDKDAIKLETEIRVKLNDKFKVVDKDDTQYIIVQPKFNHICDITRRECWLQTKEYAMQHWHLIEDPNYKE